MGAVLVAALVLLLVPAAAAAQCGSGSACVDYSPSSASAGTVVTVTPTTGASLPLIDSAQCPSGSVVNVEFIRGEVVVAVSPLHGSASSASFTVPQIAPRSYRVDLFCPAGNASISLEPGFTVTAPATDMALPVPSNGADPRGWLVATFALAFGVVGFAVTRTAARRYAFGVRNFTTHHAAIGEGRDSFVHASPRTFYGSPKPRSWMAGRGARELR